MRILISGASGFIGAPLTSYLSSKGHVVIPLSHIDSKTQVGKVPGIDWNPDLRLASKAAFEGFDAVIHLAGEPLSFSRWGKKKMERIYQSRVNGTSFLSEILSSLASPPKVFISASAIGIYGNRGEERLEENSALGSGFLSHVCSEWESASASLEKRKIRTIKLRFGVVLGREGGALAKMIPFYRWGLGALLGTGRQWMSWIALEDLIRAIEFVMNENIQGPINCVSPHAVRQEDFSHLLAKHLHRPHFLKIPAFILCLVLGTMAREMLLASAHVVPKQLLESRFVFRYPKIQNVLYISKSS